MKISGDSYEKERLGEKYKSKPRETASCDADFSNIQQEIPSLKDEIFIHKETVRSRTAEK